MLMSEKRKELQSKIKKYDAMQRKLSSWMKMCDSLQPPSTYVKIINSYDADTYGKTILNKFTVLHKMAIEKKKDKAQRSLESFCKLLQEKSDTIKNKTLKLAGEKPTRTKKSTSKKTKKSKRKATVGGFYNDSFWGLGGGLADEASSIASSSDISSADSLFNDFDDF